MAKYTGLGRGLDAIFMDNTVEEGSQITTLRLSEIEPNPNQPRREFDEESLHELANSITIHGLIQPIVVRPSENSGYYQIIAGERRWRASKMAGLDLVPVIVKEMSDSKAAQVALIENIQRENLNAVDEANAYKTLIDEYAMTQEELSEQIGKSRSTIANTLRLLDLPEDSLKLLAEGQLSAGHARTILGLKDRNKMDEVSRTAVAKALSVRDLEKLIKKLNAEEDAPKKEDDPVPEKGVDYTALLAQKMTQRLGKKIEIKRSGNGGKLNISFTSDDELDEIVGILCGKNIFDE